MTLRDSCAAAFVALVWGVNFVVIELGLAEVPPLLFAAVRFAVVAFPAVLFIRRPEAPWRVVVAIGATVSLGQFGLLYSALHLGMPAGVASLVLQAQVMFTIMFAALHFFLNQEPKILELAKKSSFIFSKKSFIFIH